MSIEPQYTFDNFGNPIGVFLPIEDWNRILEQIHLELPQWQKDLIDIRLAEYRKHPELTLDRKEVSKALNQEDETL